MLKRILLFVGVFIIMAIALLFPYKRYIFIPTAQISLQYAQTMTVFRVVHNTTFFAPWVFSKIASILGIILPLIFPFVFIIESLFFQLPFNSKVNLVYLIQGITIFICTIWGGFLMAFSVFSQGIAVMPCFYVVLLIEILFAVWSMLLAIPQAQKNKVLGFIFD